MSSDTVVVSSVPGSTTYHRDEDCRHVEQINSPREKALSVLGGFYEPCSVCCPEAPAYTEESNATRAVYERARARADANKAKILDVLAEEGEVHGQRLKLLSELSTSFYSHLRALRERGVVESRTDPDDGRRNLYSLATGDGDST